MNESFLRSSRTIIIDDEVMKLRKALGPTIFYFTNNKFPTLVSTYQPIILWRTVQYTLTKV